MPLPISVPDLFSGKTVEWERLECKAGWNPEAVIHTVCAFANDFHNWGGGYLVIGVAEIDNRPVLPPEGVPEKTVDRIQKELLALCNRSNPTYFPVVEPVEFQGKRIVVIWAPGGQNRPYKAPVSLSKDDKQFAYFIRMGAATVRATGAIEQELLQLTANVPFDDRMNHHAEVQAMEAHRIERHLRRIKSSLARTAPQMDLVELGRLMRIIDGPTENPRPRNVGLMFFSQRPDKFFDTAWIDVVAMPDGPAGRHLREKRFVGPLDVQLRSALEYIKAQFIEERVVKHPERAEADRFVTFPFAAVEEALANAVYHRGYDVREPIEVRVTPDAMTITSYPGPDRSLKVELLRKGNIVARRYRNRRVGEFLKELRLTEGRGTGIPTMIRAMQENGSPDPQFETDEDRTFFSTMLLRHPLDRPSHSDETATESLAPILRDILRLCIEPKSRRVIAIHLGLSHATYLMTRYLRPLMDQGLLAPTDPSPSSPKQRYVTTEAGLAALERS